MDPSQIINNPMYQAGAAALLAVVLLLGLWMRRRRNRRQIAASVLMTPQEAIAEIASRHPSFGRLMESFLARNSLAEFLEQPEVAAAFDRLIRSLRGESGGFRKKERALHLQFQPEPALPAEARASLLTIARCIYFNSNYQQSLDEEARGYLDTLLDTLT